MNPAIKKIIPFILLLILGVVALVVRKCRRNNASDNSKTEIRKTETPDPAAEVNRNRGFDRRISFIEYTEHARCRMDCRHISQAEVEEIMRDGNINYKKSDINARPCPTYALEGNTRDNQHVRIVYAQCDFKTKVVTVIDLDIEWTCSCPGDDEKYKSRN